MCLYGDQLFLPTRRGDNPGYPGIANVNTIGTASSNQSSLSFIRQGVPNDINNNIVCVYWKKANDIIAKVTLH